MRSKIGESDKGHGFLLLSPLHNIKHSSKSTIAVTPLLKKINAFLAKWEYFSNTFYKSFMKENRSFKPQ